MGAIAQLVSCSFTWPSAVQAMVLHLGMPSAGPDNLYCPLACHDMRMSLICMPVVCWQCVTCGVMLTLIIAVVDATQR
jgi:hypothetical protein